jgi:hypothetical protein
MSRDPLEWMVSAKALARRATSALGSARESTAAQAFEASTGNQRNDEFLGTPPFRPRSGTAGWRPFPPELVLTEFPFDAPRSARSRWPRRQHRRRSDPGTVTAHVDGRHGPEREKQCKAKEGLTP